MTPLQLTAIFIAALPIIGAVTGFILIRKDNKRREARARRWAEEADKLRSRSQEFDRLNVVHVKVRVTRTPLPPALPHEP